MLVAGDGFRELNYKLRRTGKFCFGML